ncbi:uncharacterized protein LOC135078492 isoform X1 [Ostrinia nubilalis]|uniref:uncharacterized protein LOC135078492 isoform X1 n=1 Tax=Ostrinia nubilalis TaxID=29057 RepID=UPI003082452D
MRRYILLIYLNYIGVFSKNYIIHLPGLNSRRVMDRVIWRVIRPLRAVSGVPNRGIGLDLLHPHLNSVHTPKPQDHNTIPIAREMTDAVTTSRSEVTTSNAKKLANKEDLLKGLKEIAEKRKTLHKCTKKHFDESPQNTNHQQNPVIISRLNKAKRSLIKASNLEEVLDIIKRGITIHSIEDPIPENLHWMKIKIPKTGH